MTPEFEEQLGDPTTLKKFYTPKMIQVGTFLGGPIVAGYFIEDNYTTFGQQGKTRSVWLYAILATIVIFAVVLFFSGNEDNYNSGPFKYIIPLLYSWATFSLVKYLQTDLINQHISVGGVTHGWGRVILISLIGCAITFATLFILLLILISMFPSLG